MPSRDAGNGRICGVHKWPDLTRPPRVSEPERGRRCWQDKKTGEKPPDKAAAQKALYGNRRRVRGRRGRRLQRCRGEVVERTFAHLYETGGMRRVWVRGHENVRKRVLIQAAACNIGLLLRRQTGVGTPRSLQGRACFGDLPLDRASDRPLGASEARLGVQMDPDGARRLNRSSPSCLNSGAQRTDFFHGLICLKDDGQTGNVYIRQSTSTLGLLGLGSTSTCSSTTRFPKSPELQIPTCPLDENSALIETRCRGAGKRTNQCHLNVDIPLKDRKPDREKAIALRNFEHEVASVLRPLE